MRLKKNHVTTPNNSVLLPWYSAVTTVNSAVTVHGEQYWTWWMLLPWRILQMNLPIGQTKSDLDSGSPDSAFTPIQKWQCSPQAVKDSRPLSLPIWKHIGHYAFVFIIICMKFITASCDGYKRPVASEQRKTGIDPGGVLIPMGMLVWGWWCALCIGSLQYGWPHILSKNPGENTEWVWLDGHKTAWLLRRSTLHWIMPGCCL